MDIDGDGVFNQDILLEDLQTNTTTNGDVVFNVLGCFGETDYFIRFENGEFRHPFNASSLINVSNFNDMVLQGFSCIATDFIEPFNYSFEDNILSVLVGSDVTFEGTRSGDELIFNYFDNEEWVLFFDSYIDPNTKIQEYNGDVTAIYTLK